MKGNFSARSRRTGFDAFADAFAFGFEVLEDSLAGRRAERCSRAAPRRSLIWEICLSRPGRL